MTTWNKITKATGSSWTKVPKATDPSAIVGGDAIGMLLAITYSNYTGGIWTKITKASSTVWTKITKAT